MDFESKGRVVKKIPVVIHHRMIDLFSAGLYSSSNKAFEELVCNSYDANANKVAVFLPSNLVSEDAVMWVCDNGESMDSDGLKTLWKIGYAKKRSSQNKDRKQIGKFGIGKLATYILANKLTHICKKDDVFRSVTMNYGKLNINSEEPEDIELDERVLEENEVIELLKPLIEMDGKKFLDFELWGENAEKSWTMAIMSDFKDEGRTIQEGRLRWVLSTALPHNPGFNLFFNGSKLESSKIDIAPLKTWVIGQDDKVAEKKKYECSVIDGQPIVNLPNIKGIKGVIELYEDSLLKGKSMELGRSHGVFLLILDRLINIDNPLIGKMEELNHAVFNRCRIVVSADELDAHLTSGRELVKDCEAFSDVQTYIEQKFNEVKTYFDNWLEGKEKGRNASYKISIISSRLARRPLINVAKKFFNGDIYSSFTIEFPRNLSGKEQKEFLTSLEEKSISQEGIITDVSMSTMAPEDPIAKFDLSTGLMKINLLHPFISNFIYVTRSDLPFKLIATAEVLTEAFMLESDIDQEIVRTIMEQRDQVLREMSHSENPAAPFVASMIKNALADPSGLEDAVFFGFKSLGFETAKIGGNGKPDGKAYARLGIDQKTHERKDYSLTYDAKSTAGVKISAADIKASACVRHRKDYSADYSVVVAKDFDGGDDPDCAASKEAIQQRVSLVRAEDFWKLVLLAIPNQLNFSDYKDFLENCHTVKETNEWIKNIERRKPDKKPIEELLNIAAEQKNDIEPPNIIAIRAKSEKLSKCTVEYLVDLVKSLESLVPRLISIDKKGYVSLETSPDKILECINKVLESDITPEYRDLFIKAFSVK